MKENETRRGSLKKLAAGAAVAVGAAMTSSQSHAAAKKADAFAIIGDRYHNPDYIRTALTRTLVKDAGITVDFRSATELLNAGTLDGYKLLIVFRDGMIWPSGYGGGHYPGYDVGGDNKVDSIPPLPEMKAEPVMWMRPEQGRAVREFVENGGGALFYHNSSHISLSSDDYRDVEGAVYTGHPPVRRFWLRITDSGHPITRGVGDFLVTDEQHYVDYQKSQDHVFMRSENADGLDYNRQGASCEAGWAYDYGKGRVCFLGPGHMISALWNPEYEKLQRNAALWLLRRG